jgi:RNA polymerase sigma-70 factor, ECF subfamily
MFLKFPGEKPKKKTEEELIKEFNSSGSLDILGELYSSYMPLVYGVCLKYLKDREESKDVVLQIFEKLIADLPKQKIENFRNWLHVVTKNYCLMQLRLRKSNDEKQKEWLLDPTNFMENHSDLHPIDKVDPDMEKALAGCIEKLKDEQKKCIMQFYFENRCYNEIAVTLGIDEKKVKSYLQNAKRNLKICIEETHERGR